MEAYSPGKSRQLRLICSMRSATTVPRFGMQGMQDSLRRLAMLSIPEAGTMMQESAPDQHGSDPVDSAKLRQKAHDSGTIAACYPERRQINWLARAVGASAGCQPAPVTASQSEAVSCSRMQVESRKVWISCGCRRRTSCGQIVQDVALIPTDLLQQVSGSARSDRERPSNCKPTNQPSVRVVTSWMTLLRELEAHHFLEEGLVSSTVQRN